ncbi:hypothetical protein Tco_0905798 [Tanacetum coccineum]
MIETPSEYSPADEELASSFQVYKGIFMPCTKLTTVITELPWGLELTRQRFIMVVRKQSDYVAAAFFNVPNGFMRNKLEKVRVGDKALKDHLRLEGLATSFAATMICCPLNKGHTVRVTFNLIRPSKLDIDKVKDTFHKLAIYSLLAFLFYWHASRMHRLSTRSAMIEPQSGIKFFLTNFAMVPHAMIA